MIPATSPWLHVGADDDPNIRLIRAVVHLAIRDAIHGPSRQANDAMRYINGHNFENDCDWLGADPRLIRRKLQERLSTMPRRHYTDDEFRAFHRRYTTEKLSLDVLADQVNTTGPTLSRNFARLGLPIRPRGAGDRSPTPRRPADALRALHELTLLLQGLSDIPAADRPAGAIRLRLEINLTLPQEKS